MAVWAEHTSLENFTQCKPQLVSISLKDSVSLTTGGHPDDKWGKPKLKEPTSPCDSHQPGMVEPFSVHSPLWQLTPTPINMFKNVHEHILHMCMQCSEQRYIGICLNDVMHPRQELHQLKCIPTKISGSLISKLIFMCLGVFPAYIYIYTMCAPSVCR